jgi:hypothetical protein
MHEEEIESEPVKAKGSGTPKKKRKCRVTFLLE